MFRRNPPSDEVLRLRLDVSRVRRAVAGGPCEIEALATSLTALRELRLARLVRVYVPNDHRFPSQSRALYSREP